LENGFRFRRKQESQPLLTTSSASFCCEMLIAENRAGFPIDPIARDRCFAPGALISRLIRIRFLPTTGEAAVFQPVNDLLLGVFNAAT